MKKRIFVKPLCKEHVLCAQLPLCISTTGGETPPFDGDDDYGTLGIDPFREVSGFDGGLLF